MPKPIQRIHLQTIDSTNAYALRNAQQLASPTLITASEQTAGRGQGDHTWDSLVGDLLATLIVPNPLTRSTPLFALTQSAAIGIATALEPYSSQVDIKWPNDLIAHNRKLAGILIQTRIAEGSVQSAAIGFGINLVPRPQAPVYPTFPPISLPELGKSPSPINADSLAENVAKCILHTLSLQQTAREKQYTKHLYRRDGLHLYADSTGRFLAQIHSIAPTGEITLIREDGQKVKYTNNRELRYITTSE